MTIESVIKAKLETVGAAYPLAMPTGATLPGMAYQFISEVDFANHSNKGNTRYRLQVACWGKTYAAAVTLKDSVKAALSYDTDKVELIAPIDGSDYKDPNAELYRKIIEFYVWE